MCSRLGCGVSHSRCSADLPAAPGTFTSAATTRTNAVEIRRWLAVVAGMPTGLLLQQQSERGAACLDTQVQRRVALVVVQVGQGLGLEQQRSEARLVGAEVQRGPLQLL